MTWVHFYVDFFIGFLFSIFMYDTENQQEM